MSRLLRRLIFYLLLLLFLAITPCLLLYAKGYSFDWQKKSFTQTGAFYLKSSPKNALVFINGKLEEKTPCLIKHLRPGKYQVWLQAQGYHPWQKTLEISPNLITEAREIILVPQNPTLELTVLENPLDKFSLNQETKKMVYLSQGSAGLFYLDLPSRQQQKLETTTSTPEFIAWSADNHKILLHQGDNWQILDLVNLKIIHLRISSRQGPIQKISWHPLDKNKLFFLQNNTFYLQDYQNKKNSQQIAKEVADFAIINNLIFYLKKPGYFLYQIDLAFNSPKQLSSQPILQSDAQEIKLFVSDNNQVALLLDKTLYLYNPARRLFESVQENVKEAHFSPDNKKLAVVCPHEIWILYLEAQKSQPQKEAGQKDLITRLSQEILQVIWHPLDNSHLILATQDKIKVAELDTRDTVNITDFLSVNNPYLQYSAKTKRLYFIDAQKLFSLEIN